MNYFFYTKNYFVSSKLFASLFLALFYYSFISVVSAQTEEQNEGNENEISIMEFIFEKHKSPTLQEDEFPQKAIQVLSKYEKTTLYKLKYDVEIAIDSEQEDNYTITFISKEVIGGMYRNFSVADYLLPEQISFDVTWGHKDKNTKKDNQTIEKQFSKVEFDIHHKISVNTSFPLMADFRPILIENIVFHYGSLQEKSLSSRIKLIDEYYEEAQKIEGFLSDLNDIQNEKGIENSKKEIEVKQKLQPIENAIRRLDAYAGELITDEEDPIKLRQQLSKLKTSYNQTRSLVFATTAESEQICQDEYQKGKQFLEEGKANLAQLAFSSVLRNCPTHIPSLILRSQLFYQEGNFDNALQDLSHLPKGEELRSVLEKESDLQTAIESVYFDLFAFFIRKGDYASKSLEFDEAFSFFSQAKQICEQNPFLPNCTEQLAPRLANAQKDQLEYLDAQIRNSLYEDNLSEGVAFVIKSKNILKNQNQQEQEIKDELKKNTEILTEKLDKRTTDALTIQNWEEALEALELNVGLKTGLTYTDSSVFWKEVGQKIELQEKKDLLIYATARYSQLNLSLTNSLLKRLTQTSISATEWEQLGQDIGKKDYYLQPTANPEEIITKYVLLNPALNKNFQKGYFQVWKELGKE